MPTKSVRVAVIGVGYVGALHAQVYARLPGVQLVGVCDLNASRAEEIARMVHCPAFHDPKDLLGRIDAASVAVPTSLHHAVSLPLLKAGVHLLIEKPIAMTLVHADALRRTASKQRAILQVGHIERFNAAIQAARRFLRHPRFIEAHRLSPYPFRGTDVSVVLDVMIHDLDLVLALVGSTPSRVEALGVPVLSRSEDIANARLVFSSGCVANLTASRVNDESVRRIRLFQSDCYLSIDSRAQTVEMARKTAAGIERQSLPIDRRPPLDDQLQAFVHAIRTGQRPVVSGDEARDALALALKIEQAMRHRQ